MAKYFSVYGTLYDDAEPLYLTTEQGVRVWDRVRDRWLNWTSLAALAADVGHTWQPREVGIPSIAWQEVNWSGQLYAPGLDDTSGLVSEAVVNGESFTGAAGATPPTSWDATGDADFSLDSAWLTITATDEVTFAQTLTTDDGSYYVLEAAIGGLTTGDVTVTVNGVTVSVGEGGDGEQNSVSKCASFMALAATTDVTFTVPAGGVLELKFVRCYLESELTGAGPTVITVPDPLPVVTIKGPYVAQDVNFFTAHHMDGREPTVGFDVDGEPDADLFLSLAAVCETTLNNGIKRIISRRLIKNGWNRGLPCDVTQDTSDK